MNQKKVKKEGGRDKFTRLFPPAFFLIDQSPKKLLVLLFYNKKHLALIISFTLIY
jgi:hypothetical protein